MSRLSRPADAVMAPLRARTSVDQRRRLLWLAASAALLATMWSQTKDEIISRPPPADGPPPD